MNLRLGYCQKVFDFEREFGKDKTTNSFLLNKYCMDETVCDSIRGGKKTSRDNSLVIIGGQCLSLSNFSYALMFANQTYTANQEGCGFMRLAFMMGCLEWEPLCFCILALTT